MECIVTANIREAMEIASAYPEPVLVAGSLFLIGEAAAFLNPEIIPDPPSMQ